MIHIAGVDEAGRGPLAGPVTVAAVILDPARTIAGLNDSKQLSERKRDALYPLILERALAWRIEFVEADEIGDRAVSRPVEERERHPDHVQRGQHGAGDGAA